MNNIYDGTNGNGYQTIHSELDNNNPPREIKEPSPTTEYIKGSLEVTSDHITWRTLVWVGFCCLCLGVALGSKLLQ